MFYLKVFTESEQITQKSNIVITHGLKPSDTLSTLFIMNIIKKLENYEDIFVEYLLENHNLYFFVFINTDGILFGNSVSNIAGSNLYEINKNNRFIQKETYCFLKQLNKIPNIILLLNFSVDLGS